MAFIVRPVDQPVDTAVRTDPVKRELLKGKLAQLLSPIEATKVAVANGSNLDIFALAVAVRNGLPAGLVAADFDGWDIEAIAQELLA